MTTDFQALISSPTAAYAGGLRFFNGAGMLNDALVRLARDLDRHGIDYAGVDAVALNQHGFQRFTADIDLLLSRKGRDRLKDLGDVQELIKIKHLDRAFANKLDKFVRAKYLELYNGVASAQHKDFEDEKTR